MEFYHTYNRGVEKRKIFLEKSDYFRGIHDFYEFNDAKAVVNLNQRLNGSSFNRSSTAINDKLREKIISVGANAQSLSYFLFPYYR